MAYAYAGQWGPEALIDAIGRPIVSTAYTVVLAGTGTAATLYTDRTKGTTQLNPGLVSSATGNGKFFADPGVYDLTVAGVVVLSGVVVLPDRFDFQRPRPLDARDYLVGSGADESATMNTTLAAALGAGIVFPRGFRVTCTRNLYATGATDIIGEAGGGITLNGDLTAADGVQYWINLGITHKGGDPVPWTGKMSGLLLAATANANTRRLVNVHSGVDYHFENVIFDLIANGQVASIGAIGGYNDGAWCTAPSRSGAHFKAVKIRGAQGAAGNEGLGHGSCDGLWIDDLDVSGMGDDMLGLHWCNNVHAKGLTLRGVDGRLLLSNCSDVEIDGYYVERTIDPNGKWIPGGSLLETIVEDPGSPAPRRIQLRGGELVLPAGVGAVATIANVALAANVATITTSAPHGFVAGASVTITCSNAIFNGGFIIASTPSSTTFSYALVHADVGSVAATGSATPLGTYMARLAGIRNSIVDGLQLRCGTTNVVDGLRLEPSTVAGWTDVEGLDPGTTARIHDVGIHHVRSIGTVPVGISEGGTLDNLPGPIDVDGCSVSSYKFYGPNDHFAASNRVVGNDPAGLYQVLGTAFTDAVPLFKGSATGVASGGSVFVLLGSTVDRWYPGRRGIITGFRIVSSVTAAVSIYGRLYKNGAFNAADDVFFATGRSLVGGYFQGVNTKFNVGDYIQFQIINFESGAIDAYVELVGVFTT